MPTSTPHLAAAHDHIVAAERAIEVLPVRSAAAATRQAQVAAAHAQIAVAILMLADRTAAS